MPLPRPSLCVLGSGSGGNSAALRVEAGVVLIDAGFSPRATAARLAQAGSDLCEVKAVCVTHFDRDHFRPGWVAALVGLRARLFCHRWHLDELRRLRGANRLFAAGLVQTFSENEPFGVIPGVRAETTRLQHDRQGTTGYRFEARWAASLRHAAVHVGYATDLGHVPEALIALLAGVDLLCLESNYDAGMTTRSSRPSFVNRRNLSDSGHLSNEQAFAAVAAIRERSGGGNPRRVVLLHRSSQCNHPTKIRRVFAAEPALRGRVTLTDQRRRSAWLKVPAMRAVVRDQLRLASA
ncbi:hypothetical protein PSMK_23050 [Phycisphaera mikurensis NBRC 102666]|uniref:Metallo-beta-lactamase domain-containing protein n=1 Tax=Phycisphaera mikurensis (strain NBRC 102666 / KCTC 22515 / FYK2301M01) TaxID=1142394 RepID=I0IGS6_PHYMF|nr:hypothetical protein PSMK_23050 [Phycisphaera mikurensis NBRC 102666]